MIVACVLRLGGDFDIDYVYRLARGVRRNLKSDYRFICLTDHEGSKEGLDGELAPLQHNWPKWWSKFELFGHPALRDERVLFFDLDTVIVGSLEDIVQYDGEFATLEDFFYPGQLATGMMMWAPNAMVDIYEQFGSNPESVWGAHKGDQQWMRTLNLLPDFIQTMFPEQVWNYKYMRGKSRLTKLPLEARVVCFHGKPRPRDAVNEAGWLGEHWVCG